MDPTMPDFPPVLAFAAPLFFAAVLIEAVFIYLRKKRIGDAARGNYEGKDAAASMTMGLGNLVSDLAMGFISLGFMMWVWQFRIFDWGVGIGAFFVCLLAQDFVYFYKHYAAHRVRWFWSAHVVHHSSEHYNLSTALRQPWNNHFTGFVILSAPLVFLGFHPLLVFLGYVFGPPGYSHDGSRKMSADLKREYLKDHPEYIGQAGFRLKNVDITPAE